MNRALQIAGAVSTAAICVLAAKKSAFLIAAVALIGLVAAVVYFSYQLGFREAERICSVALRKQIQDEHLPKLMRKQAL